MPKTSKKSDKQRREQSKLLNRKLYEKESYRLEKAEKGKKYREKTVVNQYRDNSTFLKQKSLAVMKRDMSTKRALTREKLLEEFRVSKMEGPTTACESCHKLQFPSKVARVTKKKLVEVGLLSKKTEDDELVPLCRTCQASIQQNKKPASWIGFGFCLNDVPEEVRKLNDIERHMIALRIPFMKIFSAFHVTGQKKLKGNVVNVPVDVQDSVACLPRRIARSSVIALQLKRKLAYKSYYVYNAVRPKRVWEALESLRSASFYRSVDVDQTWYEKTLADINKIPESDDELEESYENVVRGLYDTILMKNDMVAMIAPGEGRKPLSLLFDPHAEEKSFPHLFGGEPRRRVDPLSVYPKVMRSELLNKDRRFGQDTSNIFFKLRLHVIRQVNSAVNFLMVRKTKGRSFTAEEAASDSFATDKVRTDEAFRSCLGHVVNSPAYFDREKHKVFAMIRQLGKPSLFLTLSPCELDWEELHVILAEARVGRKLLESEKAELKSYNRDQISELLNSDPVVCAVYFNHRFQAMFKLIKAKEGIFSDHPVKHYYYRIEYQQRGSPHVHMLLWLDNVPDFDPKDSSTFRPIEEIIDKYISCFDDHDLARQYHWHHHTFTCYKYKGDEDKEKCRFNIPYPPMRRTQILTPFAVGENTDAIIHSVRKKIYNAVKEQLSTAAYGHHPAPDLKDLVGEGKTWQPEQYQDYLNCIRTSISRPTVFLKRRFEDRYINGYNRIILEEWQANTDIQWILDPYGLVHYLVNYINKAQRGMSNAMRDIRDRMMQTGQEGLREMMKSIGKAFVDTHEVSAQEAVFTCLGIPQCHSSVACVFVNTSPEEERTRILKTPQDLKRLAKEQPKSLDIYEPSLLDHYSKRPASLDNLCLADFATHYTISLVKKKETSEQSDSLSSSESSNSDSDSALRIGNYLLKKRRTQKVLRYRRYKYEQDPGNFMRENIMLFVPWRSEAAECVNVDLKDKFVKNSELITTNSAKYNRINFDDLEEAYKLAATIEADGPRVGPYRWEDEYRETNQYTDEVAEQDPVFGDVEPNAKFDFIKNPELLPNEDFHDLVSKLNNDQREIFSHYLHHLRQQCYSRNHPKMHIFVSGAAGVGKSLLIKAITQATLSICKKSIDTDLSKSVILLTAPTGKAAYNIGGVTLHSMFYLPLHKVETPRALSKDTLNTLSVKMSNVRTLIIDEISMVSREIFSLVDKRLRQILFRDNEWFGGLNVLLFGDFYQLPPVAALPVFSPNVGYSKNPYEFLEGPTRWAKFRLFELNKIMRQKDDFNFAESLTRLGRGLATYDDTAFFEKLRKSSSEISYCDQSIHLFYDNASVDSFNRKALEMLPGRQITVIATDVGEKRAIERAKKLPKQQTQGLLYEISLKIGAKYMVVANVDTADGLFNGAVGILRVWEGESSAPGNMEVTRLWLKFDDPKAGAKARLSCASKHAAEGLTPLERRSVEIHTKVGNIVRFVRKQFPIVPAMALTYHKSQGATYNNVAVHISKYAATKCSAIYVALSRVTAAKGLSIFMENDVSFPKSLPKPMQAITHEMEQLRTKSRLNCVYSKMPSEILLGCFNIRSLKRHIDDIRTDKMYSFCKLLFFVETGLRLTDGECSINGFKEIIRVAVSQNQKRGISAYVREDNLNKVSSLKRCSNVEFEYVSLLHNATTRFVCFYMSPKMKEKERLKLIKTQVKESKTEATNLIICGDFNCSFESQESSKKLMKLGLQRLIDAPTCDTGSCLDNVLTTLTGIRAVVYESVCSDHRPIFVCRDNTPEKEYPFATATKYTTSAALNSLFQKGNYLSMPFEDSLTDVSGSNSDGTDDESLSLLTVDNLRDSLSAICISNADYQINASETILNEIKRKAYHCMGNCDEIANEIIGVLNRHTDRLNEIVTWIRSLSDGLETNERRSVLVQLPEEVSYVTNLPPVLLQHYRPLQTTGDGSCFYHSVSLLLNGNERLMKSLRLAVIYTLYCIRNDMAVIEEISDGVFVEEVRKACIIASDAECETMSSCWNDFMCNVAMAELLKRPLIIVDYSRYRSRICDPYYNCRSLEELNERIDNVEDLRDFYFTGYLTREENRDREAIVTCLSRHHFTAMIKISSSEAGIHFRADPRILFS